MLVLISRTHLVHRLSHGHRLLVAIYASQSPSHRQSSFGSGERCVSGAAAGSRRCVVAHGGRVACCRYRSKCAFAPLVSGRVVDMAASSWPTRTWSNNSIGWCWLQNKRLKGVTGRRFFYFEGHSRKCLVGFYVKVTLDVNPVLAPVHRVVITDHVTPGNNEITSNQIYL